MNIQEASRMWQRDMSRRSRNTRRLYQTALRHLLNHLRAEQRPPQSMATTELTASHVLACVRALNESDLSTSSVHTYVTGIMSFLRFLIINDLAGFDESGLVRMRERIIAITGRQPRRRLPRAVSDADVAAIMQAAQSAPTNTPRFALLRQRNLALLHTLRITGARVSEIVNMQVGDLRVEDVSAIVTGKGNKQRMVFFDKPAWDAVHDYLVLRDLYQHGVPADSPLFLRHDRTTVDHAAISPTSVRNMLADLCAEAGLPHAITPHQFRHRLAIKVLANSNLAITQDVLGHANPATTRIYTQVAPEVLRQAVVSAAGV